MLNLWVNQGRTQGGGGGGRGAALGFSDPCGPKAGGAKTPAKVSKTHTEVTKYVREPTKKARPDSRGPSDHLGLLRKRAHQKNRAPLSIRAPLNIRGTSEYQDSSEHQGPL